MLWHNHAQWALGNPLAEDKQSRLHDAAKEVQAALQGVVRALPGQRDIDAAMQNVKSVWGLSGLDRNEACSF